MGDDDKKNFWLEDDRKSLDDMKDSRELLQPQFIKRPADKAAVGIAERIKANPTANAAAQAVARKLVDYANWVQSRPGQATAEKYVPAPVKRAQDAYLEKMTASRTPEQDLEIQILKDKNQRIQEAIDRAKAPQDIGDIDAPENAPGVRQPVQMSREFPTTPQGTADREAYIQEAIKRAKSRSPR